MSHNDITGDKIKSKVNSDSYRDNWDKVFGINNKTPKGSIADILENPSEYHEGQVEMAEYMKDKFDKEGTVKYDKEGVDTVARWVKDYIKDKSYE